MRIRRCAYRVFRVEPERETGVRWTGLAPLAYTNVYAILEGRPMPKTARIFMNNRSQAVRLPKEFQFSTPEVFIRREGEDVILSPRPSDWSALLQGPYASEGYMEGVDDLPVQERAF